MLLRAGFGKRGRVIKPVDVAILFVIGDLGGRQFLGIEIRFNSDNLDEALIRRDVFGRLGFWPDTHAAFAILGRKDLFQARFDLTQARQQGGFVDVLDASIRTEDGAMQDYPIILAQGAGARFKIRVCLEITSVEIIKQVGQFVEFPTMLIDRDHELVDVAESRGLGNRIGIADNQRGEESFGRQVRRQQLGQICERGGPPLVLEVLGELGFLGSGGVLLGEAQVLGAQGDDVKQGSSSFCPLFMLGMILGKFFEPVDAQIHDIGIRVGNADIQVVLRFQIVADAENILHVAQQVLASGEQDPQLSHKVVVDGLGSWGVEEHLQGAETGLQADGRHLFQMGNGMEKLDLGAGVLAVGDGLKVDEHHVEERRQGLRSQFGHRVIGMRDQQGGQLGNKVGLVAGEENRREVADHGTQGRVEMPHELGTLLQAEEREINLKDLGEKLKGRFLLNNLLTSVAEELADGVEDREGCLGRKIHLFGLIKNKPWLCAVSRCSASLLIADGAEVSPSYLTDRGAGGIKLLQLSFGRVADLGALIDAHEIDQLMLTDVSEDLETHAQGFKEPAQAVDGIDLPPITEHGRRHGMEQV